MTSSHSHAGPPANDEDTGDDDEVDKGGSEMEYEDSNAKDEALISEDHLEMFDEDEGEEEKIENDGSRE